MKEATYVAISTQKGGAGKTTLTVLVASYLHYVKGYNVAVVDCDFPQYSIHDMRKRDMKAVMEDGHYKVLAYEQLKRLKKNPYTIRCSRAEDAVKTAENLVAAQPDLDFVFFDLPGTINNADVVQTISQMDYIFTPIIADRVVRFRRTKYWYAAATSTNSSMRFSASSKTERHGKENKNRGHRQRSRNQLISTGRYKHSAGSEKHGRERSCPTSERSDTRSRFSTRLALQRGAGTQAQEQQAGKIGL